MHIRSLKLENGKAIVLKFKDKYIKVYFDEDEEKEFENMKQVESWVRNHYNTELPSC